MSVLYEYMDHSFLPHRDLGDGELIAEVQRLSAAECQATARFVAALAELDGRRLYLGLGCSSMFTYCTQVLHLAEHAAFNRIEAARAVRRFPAILPLLTDGKIHLSTVRLLAPHLTESNHQDVLHEASHKSKRDVEHIVSRLHPLPDVAASVRKLPSPAHLRAPTSPLAAPPVIVAAKAQPAAEPLAPGRYKVQFTVGRETYDKLRRVQDLVGPGSLARDPAAIFDRSLSLLLDQLEKRRTGSTKRRRTARAANKRTRHVPAHVRRAVWTRDSGRCRFEGSAGRCTATRRLEFHHVVPYASGGDTSAANLELRCGSHNRYEAEQTFGLFVREIRSAWDTTPRAPGPSVTLGN